MGIHSLYLRSLTVAVLSVLPLCAFAQNRQQLNEPSKTCSELPPGSEHFHAVSKKFEATPPSGAVIFYDVSGSMRGFVAPSKKGQEARFAPAKQLYPDVLKGLSQVLSRALNGRPVAARRFGTKVDGNSSLKQLTQAISPQTYRDSQINQQSRIDLVLELIAKQPSDTLSVVLTDLFLTQDQIYGTEQAALTKPMGAILRSGRAIGLLGASSRFTEDIVDLPISGAFSKAIARPFYMFIIGDEDSVLEVKRQVKAYLLAVDKVNFALFTTEPKIKTKHLSGRNWQPLGNGDSPVKPTTPVALDKSSKVEQVEIKPNAVWVGEATPKKSDQTTSKESPPLETVNKLITESYLLSANGCKWSERLQNDLLKCKDDCRQIEIDLKSLRGQISLRQNYLVRGRVLVDSIKTDGSFFKWMEDWNIDAHKEEEYIKKYEQAQLKEPATPFPTLNLLGLAQTLAQITVEERRKRPLADLEFLFRVED